MKKIFFFLLASFLCIHCKNECIDENIKLGNLSFKENTLAYIDLFEAKDAIGFSNSDGQLRTHQIEKLESTMPFLCTKVTCRPSYELEGLNGCEYYDTEDRHYTLTDGDLIIHIQAGMELRSSETEDYYEYVNVGILNQEISLYAGVITAASYTDPDSIQNSILSHYFEPKNISAFSAYTDVLEYQDDEVVLVYKKDIGLVNYKIEGVIWTLIE